MGGHPAACCSCTAQRRRTGPGLDRNAAQPLLVALAPGRVTFQRQAYKTSASRARPSGATKRPDQTITARPVTRSVETLTYDQIAQRMKPAQGPATKAGSDFNGARHSAAPSAASAVLSSSAARRSCFPGCRTWRKPLCFGSTAPRSQPDSSTRRSGRVPVNRLRPNYHFRRFV
jgi:hypothetical protein